MIILSSTNSINAYLGAWITAGIAIGGVIFSALQAIAMALGKYYIAKHKSDNEVLIEQEKTKQQKMATEKEYREQIKNAFQDYYTQTALSIYKKKQSENQIKAYAVLISYLSNIGYNSPIFHIQEDIGRGYYTSADHKFHDYLPDLKEQETRLLSQLEFHLPKEHTDDSEDLLSVQDSLQKQTKPKETKE